ncbi:replication factor C small subunit 2 [Haloferax sp. Atlit-10N]|uniref:AAA family ATPase n=1 Tax=Haloferax TaxID=2251 RepID=UPI0006789BB8|nr:MULTISPECIES: AAA family ATPase [Haloferax]RDZ42847.1 replication factor C small subunit 2 [Haloferax sp. Atlit-19N]RDZ43160.1 replication factor C small subunit 2 [Haloferax sp. Atlit-16N]RDZ57734.1 replication factor C small subunit 2 [Haloferax sp. Atlit-10N]
MDAPLWTETHAPGLEDLPQPEVRERLRRAVDEPMNLVVQGPPGVGKTAAVRALAREAHSDPENDLIELNVADFFNRTKKQIRADPRFEQFLDGRSRMAKRDMINRVLKESASYAPMSGEYKTIVLDNAESIREDFQQALRRVMEQHHRTTQFVITTRQPSKLIPPIRSRCFPVPMPAPDDDTLEALLADILDAEGVDYDDGGLQFLVDASNGNIRKAILSAQRTATEADEVTMSTVHAALGDVGFDDELKTLLINAREGDIKDARKTLTTLLDDEGYEGQELLADILRVADSTPERFADGELARLHELAGQVDLDISTGIDDRLHITHLLTSWGADVRGEA